MVSEGQAGKTGTRLPSQGAQVNRCVFRTSFHDLLRPEPSQPGLQPDCPPGIPSATRPNRRILRAGTSRAQEHGEQYKRQRRPVVHLSRRCRSLPTSDARPLGLLSHRLRFWYESNRNPAQVQIILVSFEIKRAIGRFNEEEFRRSTHAGKMSVTCVVVRIIAKCRTTTGKWILVAPVWSVGIRSEKAYRAKISYELSVVIRRKPFSSENGYPERGSLTGSQGEDAAPRS